MISYNLKHQITSIIILIHHLDHKNKNKHKNLSLIKHNLNNKITILTYLVKPISNIKSNSYNLIKNLINSNHHNKIINIIFKKYKKIFSNIIFIILITKTITII